MKDQTPREGGGPPGSKEEQPALRRARKTGRVGATEPGRAGTARPQEARKWVPARQVKVSMGSLF